MRTVRMKHGGFNPRMRQDGRVWPPYNGTISVGDEEAADLVTAGIAVYEEDEPVPEHAGFDTLRVMLPGYREPEPEPEDSYEDDAEEDEELPVQDEKRSSEKRPYTSASKEAWTRYAVAQGEPEKSALTMTKSDLIGKYGPSL